MATLKTLSVLTTASGNQAASQPTHFIRQQEFSGTLAGKANVAHRHEASDIDDLIPLLLALLGDTLEDSQSILWEISGTQLSGAQARLKANGGLLVDDEGLFVDSGTVSRPGHHHVAADVDDFAVALYQTLETLFAASPTMGWSFDGNEISGTLRLAPLPGLLETDEGLAVDFGSGTNQAARGDHSHSQLHNPVTLGGSESLDMELSGQELAAEVRLAPVSGLVIDAGGLAADFGSGTNQVSRGDHSHAQLHDPLTVLGDPSLVLAVSDDQELSGTVRLDPEPPGGFGRLAVGTAGLSVALGTDPDEAAAGNHGHSVATEGGAGFLSPTDKSRLDTLWAAGVPSGTLPPSGTMDSLHVRVLYLVNVNTGQTRAIYLGDDGHVKGLGSGTL
jgi:hypothetical protein